MKLTLPQINDVWGHTKLSPFVQWVLKEKLDDKFKYIEYADNYSVAYDPPKSLYTYMFKYGFKKSK